MIIPAIAMGVCAVILLTIGYLRGEGQHISGLRTAFTMFVGILPILVFAFIVAGMVQVLIPMKIISHWVGEGSGFRGILIGTIAGGLAPGAPYFGLPVVAALLHSGAGVGTMVAFMTGWSLLAITRVPLEIGILGWKFALIRLGCTFFFPPVAGLIAQNLMRLLKSPVP